MLLSATRLYGIKGLGEACTIHSLGNMGALTTSYFFDNKHKDSTPIIQRYLSHICVPVVPLGLVMSPLWLKEYIGSKNTFVPE